MTKQAEVEAAWRLHDAWKLRRTIALLRLELRYIERTYSGCDWCCGGGDQQRAALLDRIAALRNGEHLHLVDRRWSGIREIPI